MAASLLREISKDEHERARLRSQRMYETDMISDLLTAERRGKIQGIAEGEARGRAEGEARGIAEGEAKVISLLESGLSLEEIKQRLT